MVNSESNKIASLRSRRLKVVGERENRRARVRHAARVFCCAHYFQASATQATKSLKISPLL